MKNVTCALLASLQLASCGKSLESGQLATFRPSNNKQINIHLPATVDAQSLQAKLANIFVNHRAITRQGRGISDSEGNKIECSIDKSIPAQYSCQISTTTFPDLPEGLARNLVGLLPEGKFPTTFALLGSNGKINCVASEGGIRGGGVEPSSERLSYASCFVTLY